MDVRSENSSIPPEMEKLFEIDDSPIQSMEKITNIEVKVEEKENVESNLNVVKLMASKNIVTENSEEIVEPKAQKITRRNKNKVFATQKRPQNESDQPIKDSTQPKITDRSNRRSDQQKKAPKPSNTKMVGRKKLPNFSRTDLKLKEPTQIGDILFRSPDFPLPEYSSGAHVRLEYSSKHVVHMSIVFLKKKQQSQILISKLKPRVDFVITARNRKSKETTRIIRSVTCKFGEFFVYDDAYWNSVNVTNLKWFYALEEAVTFQVHVERLRVAGKWVSNNGILVWSLDKYLENEELQLKGAIEGVPGPYFYTARRGYRVQINVWIHRKAGNEKGVWFEVSFLSGMYDHELPKSFPHRTSISLAKNYEPSDNLVRSVEKDVADQPRYFIFVGTNTQVAGYVVDNALNYKVVIEALSHGEKNVSEGNAENVEDDEKVDVLETEDAVENGKEDGNKGKHRRVEYKKMRKASLRARKIAKKREAMVKNGKGVPVLSDDNEEISKSDSEVLQKNKHVVIVGCEETDENDIFKIEANLYEISYDKKKSGIFKEKRRNFRAESDENDIFKIQTKIFEENFLETSYDKKKKSGEFQKKRRTDRQLGRRRSKSEGAMDENDIFKIGTDLNKENCAKKNDKPLVETDLTTKEKDN